MEEYLKELYKLFGVQKELLESGVSTTYTSTKLQLDIFDEKIKEMIETE